MYEWDEAKNEQNKANHGVSFEDMTSFNWDFALLLDIQHVDGEERELSIGPIAVNLYAVVTTVRGQKTRVISLRRATNAEIRTWRKEFQHG